MITCPQNHSSETADYCSVCGVELTGSPPAALAVAPAATTGGEHCPDCGTPRESSRQVFCEVCGYNYQSRTAGVPVPERLRTAAAPPVSSPPSATPPSVTAPVPPSGTPAAAIRWELEVCVDANVYGTPNADAPTGQPPQTFTVFDPETLIGRAATEVRVQVPIRGDLGVSRRQALLLKRPDNTLVLRDLGSANGTQINGVEVVAGVDNSLKDGDVVAVGAWTRITVRAVGA